MENATQALRIAAGVLFALLILGVLVTFYNNMSELKRHEEMQKTGEQMADFNKQYDVYNRNLYGSELLSLVNKADNYNKTETYDGYQRLEITVIFKNNIGEFKKNTTYDIAGITFAMKTLENNVKSYGNKTYSGKTISQLALMRTNELEDFFKVKKINSTKITEIQENIGKYTSYKSDEVTIKSKKYECTNVEYDKTTGRIIKMSYKEL